ncbi:MAG: response regulator transcription factor [Oscillospiraceae bacterium]
MATILVVEDDRDTNEAVSEYLRSMGHTVLEAYDGNDAVALFHANTVDLALLDIMLPGRSGLEVLRELRRQSDAKILMLTALGDEKTQLAGFDGQADDYMVKPFSMVLLGRRVAALLRRGDTVPAPDVVQFGDVTVDFSAYTARDQNGRIEVTPKELTLLRLLAENPNLVLTRNQILDTLWGEDYPIMDRTIDTHISNLRKKLRLDCIVTIKGVGYKYEVAT